MYYNYIYTLQKRRFTMKKLSDERQETLAYIKTAVPISAALVLFLVSAGFIAYIFVMAYGHNELW